MGSTFLFPPAKRPIQYTITSAISDPNTMNGSSNKRSKPQPPPLPVPPGHVAFRLLSHASRIGGIIGKSGNIIKQLQQQTGAKIRVEDAPADSPDRVITIIAPSAIVAKLSITSGGVSSAFGGEVEFDASKAQEALARVFERILEVAAETDGISMAGGVVSCRLLADAKQVGSVIGKGGKVVEKIRKDFGVKIRVLVDKLPVCAGSTEEMVEIEGDVLAVKKALIAVSRCLQDSQPVDKTRMTNNTPTEAAPKKPLPETHVDIIPQRNSTMAATMPSSSFAYASVIHPLSLESDRVPSLDSKSLQQEVVFRILCSNDKVGFVIGKGGTVIRALQKEAGASITIGATVADCNERLITITALENPESRYSAAQKTVVLVLSRLMEGGMERGLESSVKGYTVAARLAVPSNQVGCLLGKGGTIISEMRKTTGTNIKILGGDQIPKCVLQHDQVVQISGELMNVKDAIYHVTGRLRDNLFSGALSAPGTRTTSLINETSPYGRLREPPRDTLRDPFRDPLRDPLRDTLSDTLRDPIRDSFRDSLRDSLRDPLRDTLGDPLRDALKEPLMGPASVNLHSSVGSSHNLHRHTSLAQSMDHVGLSHSLDRPPSPRLWSSQTIPGVNPRNTADTTRGLTTYKGGLELGSGSKSAFVTNTTVEIVVPENVIGSVYGENGNNLSRLRQISGAKVIVHEPRLGTSDRIIVISGTPDETQAAQSLLQAFILTGQK